MPAHLEGADGPLGGVEGVEDPPGPWNLAPLSRIYRGRKELIDHIFASHRMLRTKPKVSTAMAQAQGPTLRSITDDPRPEQGKPGSDHSVVMADFELG